MAEFKTTHKRAILIFADVPARDLARRRWPRSFLPLLSISRFREAEITGADLHLFTSGWVSGSQGVTVHLQKGQAFGERLENAVQTLGRLGYEQIVIVGCDCPELQPQEIELAFRKLDRHRLILGPDHRGGVYLLGLHGADSRLLSGIQWRKDTDCFQLQARVTAEEICRLPVKHDLDTLEDLHSLARSNRDWVWVLKLFPNLIRSTFRVVRGPLADLSGLSEKIRWQLPPPFFLTDTPLCVPCFGES